MLSIKNLLFIGVVLFGLVSLLILRNMTIVKGQSNEATSFKVQLDILVEADVSVVGDVSQFVGSSGKSKIITWSQDGRLDTSEQIVELILDKPTLLKIESEGYLTETIYVSEQDLIKIELLRSYNRTVIHNGGDFMMGRRYLKSTNIRIPTHVNLRNVKNTTSTVVGNIVNEFANADFSTVNLETVLSDVKLANKNKKYTIMSPSESVTALVDLGVDYVTLANNHTADFGNEGLESTISVLGKNNISYSGVCVDQKCINPFITTAKETQIVNFNFTTLGFPETLTKNLPTNAEGMGWNWYNQERLWGLENANGSIEYEKRNAGEAYKRLEEFVLFNPNEKLSAIDSFLKVYPEINYDGATVLNDGPEVWSGDSSLVKIKEYNSEESLVIVQLHAGSEYATVPSDNLKQIARNIIDAGADIVVSHHPHVVQGVEFYQGKPIFYSLGNFLFDQDISETMKSGYLRSIWEKDQLVDLEYVPYYIDGYIPKKGTKDLNESIFSDIIRNSKDLAIYSINSQVDKLVRINADDTLLNSGEIPYFQSDGYTLRIERPSSNQSILNNDSIISNHEQGNILDEMSLSTKVFDKDGQYSNPLFFLNKNITYSKEGYIDLNWNFLSDSFKTISGKNTWPLYRELSEHDSLKVKLSYETESNDISIILQIISLQFDNTNQLIGNKTNPLQTVRTKQDINPDNNSVEFVIPYTQLDVYGAEKKFNRIDFKLMIQDKNRLESSSLRINEIEVISI